MELKDILRDILKRDYGIETDAQLMQAIRKQKPLDIGIFDSQPASQQAKAC